MKILIISAVPTPPGDSGNAGRILNFCEELKALGHEVHFFYIDLQQKAPDEMQSYWGDHFYHYQYIKPWRKYRWHGIPIPDRFSHGLIRKGCLAQGVDQFFDEGVIPELKQIQEREGFEAVVVEYVFYSKALEAFSDSVLKVIDTHDVYTDRHKRLVEAGLQPEWFFTSHKEERKGLERAHQVIAIQENEARFFRSLMRNERTEVKTIGHLFTLPDEVSVVPIQTPLCLGMIASHNTLNQQALDWFMREVYSLLEGGLELKLWGSVCDHIKDQKGLIKLGRVESLEEAYQNADLFLNPIKWGTGLKIKTIEALAYGRLVLTTSCGIDGLEAAEGKGCHVADTAEEWAQMIQEMGLKTEVIQLHAYENRKFAESYLAQSKSTLRELFLENP